MKKQLQIIAISVLCATILKSMEPPPSQPSTVLLWSQAALDEFCSQRDRSSFMSWLPNDVCQLIKPYALHALSQDSLGCHDSDHTRMTHALNQLAQCPHPWLLTLQLYEQLEIRQLDVFHVELHKQLQDILETKEQYQKQLTSLNAKYEFNKLVAMHHQENQDPLGINKTNAEKRLSLTYPKKYLSNFLSLVLDKKQPGLVYHLWNRWFLNIQKELVEVCAFHGLNSCLQELHTLRSIATLEPEWHTKLIFQALANGHYSTFDTLCRLGIDINAQDCYGNTALHRLAQERRDWVYAGSTISKALRLLAAAHADLTIVNNDGKRAWQLLCDVRYRFIYLAAKYKRTCKSSDQ